MERKNYIQGLIYGASAFVLWGLLPLYWKMVKAINPYQIFAQRAIWAFLFVMIYTAIKNKGLKSFIDILKVRKNWINILGPTFFISINWILYIWAVNNDYVIESSLGYFINPLVLTSFGAIFFKEKLTKLQKIGITFAIIGVVLKTILYGQIPYIGLILAFAFGTYGLLKKKSSLNSLNGLGFETMIISIPSLIYLLNIEARGLGISGNLPWQFWILISITGVVTAVPLLFYAEGTKRLPLSVVGFLQYIAPTIMIVLGIFVFKEPFTFISLIPFSFIWIGLGFFSYSQYKLLSQK